MSAPTSKSAALGGAQQAAASLTLLDALARAPAAAALIVAALERAEDRKALRLAHPQLRDAVGEATTRLDISIYGGVFPRAPTAQRWPRLRALTISVRCKPSHLAALEALGSETWASLRALCIVQPFHRFHRRLARVLAAALRRMPALHMFELQSSLEERAAAELFRPSTGGEGVPQLRVLSVAYLFPEDAHALAASGWRLEDLDVNENRNLTAAGAAALVAAPTFALRSLNLGQCRCILNTAFILSLANASWPLEELNLEVNDLRAADGPALAALSRHARLRRLDLGCCRLSAAGFKALVEAVWPALTFFRANYAKVEFDGADALGADAFAGFPALVELQLLGVRLGEAGARLLARRSRRWPRLFSLDLYGTQLNDAAVSALALGDWPRLAHLDLSHNRLGAPPTLEDARRWAPALTRFQAEEVPSEEDSGTSNSEWVDD